jgi:hypothetical protein
MTLIIEAAACMIWLWVATGGIERLSERRANG